MYLAECGMHASSTCRSCRQMLGTPRGGVSKPRRAALLIRRAEPDDNRGKNDEPAGVPIESLFAKELQRRGMSESSMSSIDVEFQPSKLQDPFTRTSTSKKPSQRVTKTPPKSAKDPVPLETGQRERTMALVNEGLEGLFPRASELIKLGGSIFLAFVPFILVTSALFGGIYLVMGQSFVHGGDVRSGPPRYVDPQSLLSEPTVDPMIPFQ